MDKIIPFNKGIHRQPSLGEAGELSECVNLIPKNGELVNVRGLEEMEGVPDLPSDETFRVIHHTRNADYYISSVDNKVLCRRAENGEWVQEQEFTTKSYINDIIVVGNTLVVSCSEDIYYLLFKHSSYVDLGAEFPEVKLEFGLVRHLQESEIYNEMSSGTGTSEEELRNRAKTKMDVLLGECKNKGFVSPFFVRYALRMYNDTHINISCPVLMIPSTQYEVVSKIYKRITVWHDERDRHTSHREIVGAGMYWHDLAYRWYNADVSNLLKSYQDLILSMDIYVSTPIRLYGGEPKEFKEEDDKNVTYSCTDISSAVFDLGKIEFDEIDNEIKNDTWSETYLESNTISERLFTYGYSNDEILSQMENERPFFRIASIPIDEISKDFSVLDFDPEVNNKTQGELEDDYVKYRRFSAQNIFSYNNRIIASNVGGYLFSGYDVRTMFPAGSKDADDLVAHQLYIHVMDGDKEVVVRGDESLLSAAIPFRFLYYPNRNAFKATLMYEDEFFSFPLKKHVFLNGAYYFGGFNKKMLVSENKVSGPPAYDIKDTIYGERNEIYYTDVNNPFVFDEKKAIAVGSSEIIGMSTAAKALSQGQFGQFPLYVFCTDGIWALEVNTDGTFSAKQPISRDVCNNPNSITQIDGAVVFTTEQGLKLIQGSDVVLLSGNLEGHNVDESVYFKEGFFSKYGLGEFDKLVNPEKRDIRDILNDCQISYDYVNQLLRIFPKREDDANTTIPYKYYVYSFTTQEFATVIGKEFDVKSEDGTTYDEIKAVVADYPSSVIQIGNKLYRPMETEREGVQNGLLLTRPLAFDSPFALKKLHDLRLQYSNFTGESKCKVVLYASNDGKKWTMLKSLRGGSYKYFRIAVITKMTDADALTGAIVRYELERTNKLR